MEKQSYFRPQKYINTVSCYWTAYNYYLLFNYLGILWDFLTRVDHWDHSNKRLFETGLESFSYSASFLCWSASLLILDLSPWKCGPSSWWRERMRGPDRPRCSTRRPRQKTCTWGCTRSERTSRGGQLKRSREHCGQCYETFYALKLRFYSRTIGNFLVSMTLEL